MCKQWTDDIETQCIHTKRGVGDHYQFRQFSSAILIAKFANDSAVVAQPLDSIPWAIQNSIILHFIWLPLILHSSGAVEQLLHLVVRPIKLSGTSIKMISLNVSCSLCSVSLLLLLFVFSKYAKRNTISCATGLTVMQRQTSWFAAFARQYYFNIYIYINLK